MVIPEDLNNLFEEVNRFRKNLSKDNLKCRQDLNLNNRKLDKLNCFRKHLLEIRNRINKDPGKFSDLKEIKECIFTVDRYCVEIDAILKDRVQSSSNSETMGEKFDLRTAASLIPQMNGSEAVTKQLIDGIELYDSLLDDSGKTLLTKYVLKTKLTESAKIRLKCDYVSNESLIEDLRIHFISVKSTSALALKLTNAKQGSKAVEDFGKSIEQLMVDLTITQAEGKQESVNVLTPINEKLAINSFANGLQNYQLRTIIKARNYNKLSDAIRGAKDEEMSLPEKSQQVFHMRGRGRHFSTGQRRSTGGTRYFNSNSTFRGNRGSHYRGTNRGRTQNIYSRGNTNPSNTNRGNSYYNFNNYRGRGTRNYFLNQNGSDMSNSNGTRADPPQGNSNSEMFFRAPH